MKTLHDWTKGLQVQHHYCLANAERKEIILWRLSTEVAQQCVKN